MEPIEILIPILLSKKNDNILKEKDKERKTEEKGYSVVLCCRLKLSKLILICLLPVVELT